MSAAASFLLEADGVREGLSHAEITAAIREGTPLWVDIDSIDDLQWRQLSTLFHFHPLPIEDTRSPQGRVKIEEYGDYLFIVVRETDFDQETTDPYDLSFQNVCIFLGRSYVVTVHAGDSPAVDSVVDHLRAGPLPAGTGADRIAYYLLDAVIDRYFPLLDQIDTFVADLEEGILSGQRAVLDNVFHLRRTLAQLRRHLSPAREVLATLANRPSTCLHAETQIYFRDVYDHVVRELEAVETYRDLLSGAMETYFSVISNRMNEVIKAISVIGTIVLPPTLIASIYGMNFRVIPMAGHPLGFWFAILLMAGISVVFVAYLWWKRWL